MADGAVYESRQSDQRSQLKRGPSRPSSSPVSGIHGGETLSVCAPVSAPQPNVRPDNPILGPHGGVVVFS
jgi:hypothetical protein